ncbi:MAG: hypothetical protein OXG03_02820 [Gammaproteobacteria bacterium]|nr:hypothetical protein [Gammaproteobacteria bacterium]
MAVLVLGIALVYAVQQLPIVTPEHLNRMAIHAARWRGFLERYGFWLHLGLHGATYLYLILRWRQLIGWLDRKRVERGHMPLSALEQRQLMFAVAAVCVAYEILLMLRHLD